MLVGLRRLGSTGCMLCSCSVDIDSRVSSLFTKVKLQEMDDDKALLGAVAAAAAVVAVVAADELNKKKRKRKQELYQCFDF